MDIILESPHEAGFRISPYYDSNGDESWNSVNVASGRFYDHDNSSWVTAPAVEDIGDSTNKYIIVTLDPGVDATISATDTLPTDLSTVKLLAELVFETYTLDTDETPDDPDYLGQQVIKYWKIYHEGDYIPNTGWLTGEDVDSDPTCYADEIWRYDSGDDDYYRTISLKDQQLLNDAGHTMLAWSEDSDGRVDIGTSSTNKDFKVWGTLYWDNYIYWNDDNNWGEYTAGSYRLRVKVDSVLFNPDNSGTSTFVLGDDSGSNWWDSFNIYSDSFIFSSSTNSYMYINSGGSAVEIFSSGSLSLGVTNYLYINSEAGVSITDGSTKIFEKGIMVASKTDFENYITGL